MNEGRRRQLITRVLIAWHRWIRQGQMPGDQYWERFEEGMWELCGFERHEGLLTAKRFDREIPYGGSEGK